MLLLRRERRRTRPGPGSRPTAEESSACRRHPVCEAGLLASELVARRRTSEREMLHPAAMLEPPEMAVTRVGGGPAQPVVRCPFVQLEALQRAEGDAGRTDATPGEGDAELALTDRGHVSGRHPGRMRVERPSLSAYPPRRRQPRVCPAGDVRHDGYQDGELRPGRRRGQVPWQGLRRRSEPQSSIWFSRTSNAPAATTA